MLSDRCQISWGRRRPFILIGAAGTIASIFGLTSADTILHSITRLIGINPDGGTVKALVVIGATAWLLAIHLFMQPLQLGVQALIIDSCPSFQQAQAQAWSSRASSIGTILGYLITFVVADRHLPLFGVSESAWLAILAAILVFSTVSITTACVQEQNPKTLAAPVYERKGFKNTLTYILWSFKTMPPVVRQVCAVQFFAWNAWFPFLLYLLRYV